MRRCGRTVGTRRRALIDGAPLGLALQRHCEHLPGVVGLHLRPVPADHHPRLKLINTRPLVHPLGEQWHWDGAAADG